ncbi:unnamed protein product, partial [Ectocarpus sp. 12 AP-2014]
FETSKHSSKFIFSSRHIWNLRRPLSLSRSLSAAEARRLAPRRAANASTGCQPASWTTTRTTTLAGKTTTAKRSATKTSRGKTMMMKVMSMVTIAAGAAAAAALRQEVPRVAQSSKRTTWKRSPGNAGGSETTERSWLSSLGGRTRKGR